MASLRLSKKFIAMFTASALCFTLFSVCAQSSDVLPENNVSTNALTTLEDGVLYKIVSDENGKVIQGDKYCYEENAQLTQADYTGELNQLWRARIQDDGTLMLESAAVSGRYLTMKVASTRDNSSSFCQYQERLL